MFSQILSVIAASIMIAASSLGCFLCDTGPNIKQYNYNNLTSQETYKVGVYERDGFLSQDTKSDGTKVFSGYMAELLSNIELNSKLKFEYVIGTNDQLLNKLNNGEIDLYPGCLYSDEYSAQFDYTSTTGNLYGVLFTSTNNTYYQNDFASYNGLAIGMIRDFKINESFAALAKKEGFTYTPVYYDFIQDGLNDMQDKKINCFLTDSLFRANNYKILYTFSTQPYYCLVNKNNFELKALFNEAVDSILKTTPDYFYSLYDKYYSTAIYGSKLLLTRLEQYYIDSRSDSPIKFAYHDNCAPCESTDSKGNITGITKSLLDRISAITGLTFEYTSVPNNICEYDLDQVEAFASYNYSINEANNYNITFTDPVFKDAVVRISKPKHNKVNGEIVAIPSYMLDDAFEYLRKNTNYKEYSSALQCFEAVASDKVDATYIKETTANYYLKNILYHNYDKTNVSDNLYSDYTFSTTKNASPYLYQILQKAIKSFTSAEIYEIQSQNLDGNFIYTLFDKIQYDQTFQFYLIITIIVLAGVTISVITYSSIKRNYISSSFVENTKIYNRQNFFRTSSQMIKGSKKTFVFALLQIDRYQVLHATFGDEEIRKYLYEFIECVEKRYHHKDNFRYGLTDNDTFGFCFEYNPDSIDDFTLASKELSKEFYNSLGEFHIGFYIIKDNSQNPSFFYDYAKFALEKAQNNKGKNVNFAFYDESIIQKIQVSNYYLSELPRALKEHEFIIYLQPKVDIKSGLINGAEALVRWNHPIEGIILPGKFIPIFEQNGTIVDIDKYVWELTCDFICRNRAALKKSIPISVNLSRSDVYSFGIFSYILELVKKYKITPDELNFEITESLCAENPQLINNLINQLRSYKFRVSMDDFGSAYSSLNMLKTFMVDDLKIDLAFLKNTEWNGVDKKVEAKRGEYIIKSVVEMARNLKMNCICEGVETKEQLELIKRAKCKNAQGYYYSKPLPQNAFLELLKKGSLNVK